MKKTNFSLEKAKKTVEISSKIEGHTIVRKTGTKVNSKSKR